MNFDWKNKDAWVKIIGFIVGLLIVIGVWEPDFAERVNAAAASIVAAVFTIVAAVLELRKPGGGDSA